MRCLDCGYELEGVPVGICPECGRGFDPGDRTTFASHGSDRGYRWLVACAAVAAAWPGLLTLWMYLAYVVARLVLDRWPSVTGMDDPNGIPIVRLMHLVWSVGQVLLLPVTVGGVGAIVLVACRRWRLGALLFAGAAASWGFTIALANWIDVWGWFFD